MLPIRPTELGRHRRRLRRRSLGEAPPVARARRRRRPRWADATHANHGLLPQLACLCPPGLYRWMDAPSRESVRAIDNE